MRSPKSSKSNICTEGVIVYVAGINAEVSVHYPGRSVEVLRDQLHILRRMWRTMQKSAESIVVYVKPRRRDSLLKTMKLENLVR